MNFIELKKEKPATVGQFAINYDFSAPAVSINNKMVFIPASCQDVEDFLKAEQAKADKKANTKAFFKNKAKKAKEAQKSKEDAYLSSYHAKKAEYTRVTREFSYNNRAETIMIVRTYKVKIAKKHFVDGKVLGSVIREAEDKAKLVKEEVINEFDKRFYE